MLISCKSILEFLKKDFGLVFGNNIILAIIYVLLIPVIRGISNLNNIQSAQCLSQSVSLIGIILIVPIVRPEIEIAVKEIIYTKSWSYLKSVLIRIACSFVLVTFFIITFTYAMRLRNCTFPFWSFTGITILYAVFMGVVGLVVSVFSQNTIIGYLFALGYWTFCQLQIIQEGGRFYLFPIINGEIHNEKIIILIMIDILLLFLFIALQKKDMCRK